jgi:2-polyprenyl-6-methoxyphenol hydroxylase-like FAD-dependent oxidoreductase
MSHAATTTLDKPIVIVGAGPAGAALAYLLARRGLPVRLLERHADFSREFRGEGLQPSGLDCLTQMGLAAQLAQVPQHRLGRVLFALGERTVELEGLRGVVGDLRLVSQPGLLAMLTREAAAFPGFRLDLETRVRDVVRGDDGRITGVAVSRPGGDETIEAALVIACDGRNSVIRRRLEIPLVAAEQSFDILWSRGDLSAVCPDGAARIELNRQGDFIGVYPAPAGGHQIGVLIRKGGFKEIRARGEARSLEWVAERCTPELAAALRSGDMCRPILLDVICGRAPTWSRPGVLLIGDAVHPMSPLGGQGINIALRDALIAANHLVPALEAGDATAELDRACAAIEAERLPEVEAIQAIQTRQGRRFLQPIGALTWRLLPALLRFRRVVTRIWRPRQAFRTGMVDVRLAV